MTTEREIMPQIHIEEKYKKAACVICKQGMVHFPVSDTAIAIVAAVIGGNEEELDLIYAFRDKPSQTTGQLVESSGFSEEKITQLTSSIAKKGLIFNQPNSSGVMVYRLLPLMMVGLMEYKFMLELSESQEEKDLANLFEKLLNELRDHIQKNYDSISPLFNSAPAVDRTVPARIKKDGTPIRIIPVNQVVKISDEFVLPSQSVEDIINKFDDIAVGHCFCRQRKRLLGRQCDIGAPTLNCFTFGKSARHTTAQGFAKKVTKEEALKIMKEAEQEGLIHKAFHPGSKESSTETSICNCCKDCCDTFGLWRNGTLPLINSTYYLSMINYEVCTGCGVCVELCPTDAIVLNEEGVAQRDENTCLGCGVCSRFCPEEAISLKEGYRRVFIMPPRLQGTQAI
jgi:Na+-translocating ferredoxin:NAD+ oxidoreductase RNF subunit RnfB